MKIQNVQHIILCMLFGLVSCRTAELSLSDDLKEGTTMAKVKGKQGFQVGQVLRFGDYSTGIVERGWTQSYRIPFVVAFSGADEQVSFQQFGPGKQFARVALLSRIRSAEMTAFNQYFSVVAPVRNVFAGGIELSITKENWEFCLQGVDGNFFDSENKTIGFLRSRNDRFQINIEGIRELQGTPAWLQSSELYGYAFKVDGNVVGAVSVLGGGKVWTKDNIHPELKLVLASVCSGLLLRNNMHNAIDSFE